ncbi:MAG: trypsin-like peptidase domain-containing protein [Flavobacteriales bacterium]
MRYLIAIVFLMFSAAIACAQGASRKNMRAEGDKYLTAGNIRFNLAEGDITEEYFRNEDSKAENKVSASEENKSEIIEYSDELAGLMLNNLVEWGYLDTSDRFLPDYKNSLHVDMAIEEAHFRIIRPSKKGLSKAIYIEFVSDFQLKSYYGKELYRKSVSKELKLNRSSSEKEVRGVFSNLIKMLVKDFVFDDEVQKLVTSTEYYDLEDEASFETVSIPTPSGTEKPEDWKKSVATIILEDGHGSACIISADGYLISNFHVVGQNETVKVKFHDGSNAIGIVLRKHPDCDLALIKVDISNLVPLPIAESEIEFGEDVYVLGTPADTLLAGSMFKGVISGKRNFDGAVYLQTDAKVNVGNSGGAMINSSGELVGIVSSKYAGFGIEGIGFAVPIIELKRLKIEVLHPTPSSAPVPKPQTRR